MSFEINENLLNIVYTVHFLSDVDVKINEFFFETRKFERLSQCNRKYLIQMLNTMKVATNILHEICSSLVCGILT